MRPLRIGINGLGRIGRTVVRSALQRQANPAWGGTTRPGPDLEIVAANDRLDVEALAYLLEFDSVHGRAPHPARVDGARIEMGPMSIRMFNESNPQDIPWSSAQVDIVLECTGAFGRRRELERHLSEAPKVLLGAPGEADVMIVTGVNDHELRPEAKVISAASCTTHAVAPVLSVLDQMFKVRWALLGTVHAYTAGQSLIDAPAPARDLRRGRAAGLNIVPTTTHATRAVTQVLPALAGKLAGSSTRVPVPDVSMFDLTVTLDRPTELAEVLEVLTEASRAPELRGILDVRDQPLVSADLVGELHSSVVDVGACVASGPLLRIAGWYDN
ncbi:MAG: type I glyceraldehyde-3-phosphate dehydrogenase, partial [Nannocystaceae bacterium]